VAGTDAAPPGARRATLKVIAAGAVLLVATTTVGVSGAYFTSTSRSPGNRFAAAGVGMHLSETGPVVDGSAMVPGDVRSGDQTVTNTGHKATLVLDVANLDRRSRLTRVLDVRVRQTSPPRATPAYDGPLAGLSHVLLGTLARGERRTWTITVTWPAREDSRRLEGTSTSLDFDWRQEAVP
jgi:hypothetical protein